MVLAKVCPGLESTPGPQGHILLHHNVRKGEVCLGDSVYIRAGQIFGSHLVVSSLGNGASTGEVSTHGVDGIVIVILTGLLGFPRIQVIAGELHIQGHTVLEGSQGFSFATHLEQDFGHLELDLGSGEENVGSIVTENPAATAFHGGSRSGGAETVQVGSRAGRTGSSGEAGTEIGPVHNGFLVRHLVIVLTVNRAELGSGTGIVVTGHLGGVANNLIGVQFPLGTGSGVRGKDFVSRGFVVLRNGTGHNFHYVV